MKIVIPLILMGLLYYSQSMIPLLFLGHLSELALTGGLLVVGITNVTHLHPVKIFATNEIDFDMMQNRCIAETQ